jgi:putative Holliday junction resolvase
MNIVEDMLSLPSLMQRGQILMGLDLGTKTIGIALSDTSFTIASPSETIKRQKLSVDAQALHKLIAARQVGGVVMGYPLNMDGSAGPRVQATRAFIRNLAKIEGFPLLPVVLWDERLSTAAVTRTLIDADASRARRAELVDKLAATYILQGYLDFLRSARQ